MTLSKNILLVLAFTCPAFSLSAPATGAVSHQGFFGTQKHSYSHFSPVAVRSSLFRFRGGDQESVSEPEKQITSSFAMPMLSSIASVGQIFAKSLESNPVATKSVTACCIFALSDFVAQRFSNTEKEESKYDVKRTVTSALVGLLYFGPAAHAWYYHIFRFFPGTGLASTLQKAVMGQLLFGPSFTCIFFATSLLNTGTFSLGAWWSKIRTDLPGTWAAGLGFWPFVDLISYSLIAPQWIPLFVNTCSFIWTVYLSIVANRRSQREE